MIIPNRSEYLYTCVRFDSTYDEVTSIYFGVYPNSSCCSFQHDDCEVKTLHEIKIVYDQDVIDRDTIFVVPSDIK